MILHNGQHKFDEPYFEWWYFHFISESGYYFNLLLHPTDIFAVHRNPYMSVSLATPDDEMHYFREELPSDVFDQCQRKILIDRKNLVASEEDSHIYLNVAFENFRFQGKLAKSKSAYSSRDGVLFRNETHRNYWMATVPHGKFDFDCELHGEKFTLSGSAYHDHNWGNARIQEYFQSWIWSHLVWDGGFLLFYHVIDADGSMIQRGLLGHEGNVQDLESFELEVVREEELLESIRLPSEIRIVKNAGAEILINVRTKKIFRKRQDSDYEGFVPNYYRAKCAASVRVGDEFKNAVGLVECLRIEKKG